MNNIYDVARVRLLTADLDWPAIDARLVAWTSPPDYVPTDQTPADIVARGGILLATSEEITAQTVSIDGTAQTDQVVIRNDTVGPPVTWFTMIEEPDKLILYIDDAAELPFDHRGLDIVVQPDWLENRGWWRP